MKKTMLLAATLLLCACAGTSTRDGLVYRDGSWYSPADGGRGDYYTGSEHNHDHHHFYSPWVWSVGFVPYGGYCPVMYRYCTSFWAEPWYGYSSGYYPFAWAAPRPLPRRHHRVTLMARDPLAAGPDSALAPPTEPAASGRRGRAGGWAGRRAAGGVRERPRRADGERR